MWLVYLTLQVLVAAVIADGVWLKSEMTFREWQVEHGKFYSSEREAKHRMTVFEENRLMIDEWNAKSTDGVRLSLNQFADMSPAEFKQKVLMSPRKPVEFDESRYAADLKVESLPASFDWRDQDKVSEVKDQGTVGSCWAFSTVGNIEGQWAMAGHNLTSLSAELLVDCDDEKDPARNRADCGVFGGWPYLAYQFIEKIGGVEAESDYPYCSGKGQCFPCAPADYNKTLCGPEVPSCNKTQSCGEKLDKSKFLPGLEVSGWQAISKNETEIAAQLVKLGPLSIAINAELLQFYHSGVWHPPFCDPTSIDHAILLVGFGTEKDIFSEKPYWLIKNSWGTKWGLNGYFKMERGTGQCGINTQVTTSILSKSA